MTLASHSSSPARGRRGERAPASSPAKRRARLRRAAAAAPARLLAAASALHVLLLPHPAYAVQIHGTPEGLYVHMMAHVFFSAAMISLLYTFRKRPPGTGSGWRFFKWSIAFFLLWNIDTFVVHWLSASLPEGALERAGSLWQHRLLFPLSAEKLLYYVGQLDHLLSLPAVIFLTLSLRSFCRKAQAGPRAAVEP